MDREEAQNSRTAGDQWPGFLRVGDIVYVAGLTAERSGLACSQDDDEYDQTWTILSRIHTYLASQGASMSDVAKLTIFVTNIDKQELVEKACREFFVIDAPVSSLVEVSRLAGGKALVEIEAVAHLG